MVIISAFLIGNKILLTKYVTSPKDTGDRLYYDSLHDVLSKSNLMLVDYGKKGGNSVFYLPMMQNNNLRTSQLPNIASSHNNTNVSNSNIKNTNQNNTTTDYNRWRVAQ